MWYSVTIGKGIRRVGVGSEFIWIYSDVIVALNAKTSYITVESTS